LEGAAALEIYFRDFTTSDDISSQLPIFNKLRLPRVAVTRILNAAYGGKDVGDEVREYCQDPLPPLNALLYMEPCRDFFCDYDIFKEAEKALSGESVCISWARSR
jgi:hypothetical protein